MKFILENHSDAGTQTKHIPGGCTSFGQPIHVRVTQPLKDRVVTHGRTVLDTPNQFKGK